MNDNLIQLNNLFPFIIWQEVDPKNYFRYDGKVRYTAAYKDIVTGDLGIEYKYTIEEHKNGFWVWEQSKQVQCGSQAEIHNAGVAKTMLQAAQDVVAFQHYQFHHSRCSSLNWHQGRLESVFNWKIGIDQLLEISKSFDHKSPSSVVVHDSDGIDVQKVAIDGCEKYKWRVFCPHLKGVLTDALAGVEMSKLEISKTDYNDAKFIGTADTFDQALEQIENAKQNFSEKLAAVASCYGTIPLRKHKHIKNDNLSCVD